MEKLYKNFFDGHRILVADTSSVYRISIAKALTELGAANLSITLADSFEAAEALIASKAFTILVCEYELGERCGIDLIRALRRKAQVALSAIITKNQTDVAEAQAAENDVDVFVRKPFSMDALKKAFEDVLQERGKLAQPEGDHASIEAAIELLQRSQTRTRVYDRAGYRALVQLFESSMSEGNKLDSYRVLRRLVTTYPVHPDRLSAVFRLAVETRNFDEIDSYHSLFLNIESKGDELIRHAYAALVSSGKASLQEGDLESALRRFKWASAASGKKPAVLREIALALVNRGFHSEADKFVAEYPRHERQSMDFLTLDYYVMSKSQPLHLVLQRGRELIQGGHEHPVIYELLIEACKRAGHHSEAESLAMDAGRRWPAVLADAQPSAEVPTV